MRPIQLVPITLVWRRRPKKLRGGLRDFLFGDPDEPGALRSLLARRDSKASRTASNSGTPIYSGYVRGGRVVPVRGYVEPAAAYDNAAEAAGAIPKKYKELMAIAVALTRQYSYCIEVHRQAALKAGVTEEEPAETVHVAAAIRSGGAITHGTHLFEG